MSGEQEPWVSDRARAEIERKRRVVLFDELVDRALDGAGITVPEAIKEYETELSYYEQQRQPQ